MKTPPLMRHQITGISRITKQKDLVLFDEPGTGKSRQVIEAAEILWRENQIDCVVIVCPAQVKFNWIDEELGEIKKYSKCNTSVKEVGGREIFWINRADESNSWLPFLIISYEYLRVHVKEICSLLSDQRYLLIFDESSALRNRTTAQWKAALGLRYGKVKENNKWSMKFSASARCVMLNGTPIANHLLDLWGQFHVLNKDILPLSWWQFREKHCVMGGWMKKQVVGYRDLDGKILGPTEPPKKLIDSLSPWLLCRRKQDVLDLPPKTHHVIEIPLDVNSWKIYRQMNQELIVELDKKFVDASNAAVKTMRLAQITSGFLKHQDDVLDHEVSWRSFEKQEWLKQWLYEQSEFIVVWCHFRAQIEFLYEFLTQPWQTNYNVHKLLGGMSHGEKDRALRDFNPAVSPSGARGGNCLPGVLLAQAQAGGMGLNLARASINVYLSSSFSNIVREQSEERIYRPGQVRNVRVLDVLATGPKGQRTVDHLIYRSNQGKAKLNSWTKQEWINFLKGE